MMLLTSLADSAGQRLEQVEPALFDQFQQLFSSRISGHRVELFRISLFSLSILTKPCLVR